MCEVWAHLKEGWEHWSRNIILLVVPEPFLSDRHMQFFAKKIKLIGCGSNKGNEKIFGLLERGFSYGMDWGISSSYTW